MSQLSIKLETKRRLDQFRMDRYDEILGSLEKPRRFVSVSEVIDYMLDQIENK